jgi:CheY-like chemotaxis protein
MEIVTSRVSVYEIELDLNHWKYITSDQVPGFYDALAGSIESIKEHKCMTGKAGGFLSELRTGTNFAHVIEHVILELIHLVSPDNEEYSGWTRKKEKQMYIIHYSAPDFLTARLGAILGLELVKKLVDGESIDISYYINTLKDPQKYFTQETTVSERVSDIVETIGVYEDMEIESEVEIAAENVPTLTELQVSNIKEILAKISRHMNSIVELWRNSFFEYSGQFGKAIIDKIEWVNIHRYMDTLIAGDFKSYYRGVANVSNVISSFRIPLHFIIHATWLFKNSLFNFLIQEFKDNEKRRYSAIHDFEDFFQIVLNQISKGYSRTEVDEAIKELQELTEFKELKRRQGQILVVDDDQVSRRVFRDILELHGFRTTLAEDGQQALDILNEQAESFSLIILDMNMPGLSGKEVYLRIKVSYPDIKVLISSGYPLDEETQKLLTGCRVTFLSKPFKVEKLLEIIEAECDGCAGFFESIT